MYAYLYPSLKVFHWYWYCVVHVTLVYIYTYVALTIYWLYVMCDIYNVATYFHPLFGRLPRQLRVCYPSQLQHISGAQVKPGTHDFSGRGFSMVKCQAWFTDVTPQQSGFLPQVKVSWNRHDVQNPANALKINPWKFGDSYWKPPCSGANC